MKKGLKYLAGGVMLLLFVLLIDPTGVGFRAHLRKIRDWANGVSKAPRFEIASRTKGGK